MEQPAPLWTPPPPKKSNKAMWIILFGITLPLLICSFGAVWASLWVQRQANVVAKAPPLAGNPRYEPLRDKWVRATFPEVPWSLDLPKEIQYLGVHKIKDLQVFPTSARYSLVSGKYQVIVSEYWISDLGNMIFQTPDATARILLRENNVYYANSIQLEGVNSSLLTYQGKGSFDTELTVFAVAVPRKDGMNLVIFTTKESEKPAFIRVCHSIKLE